MMSSPLCASRSLLTLLGSEVKRLVIQNSTAKHALLGRLWIPFNAHSFPTACQISCTEMQCAVAAFDKRKKDEL